MMTSAHDATRKKDKKMIVYVVNEHYRRGDNILSETIGFYQSYDDAAAIADAYITYLVESITVN